MKGPEDFDYPVDTKGLGPLRTYPPNPQVPPPGPRPSCRCLVEGLPLLHGEEQDTSCEAWQVVLENIELAVKEGQEEFNPLIGLAGSERHLVITLPESIERLVNVRKLFLYASHLVRIPPQIAGMRSLSVLDVYTSESLHFLPYEITRCKNLDRSRASTRVLYGNHKYRPPFPDLTSSENLPAFAQLTPSSCSVCQAPLDPARVVRRWITLDVATDAFPLLVNACSIACIEALPTPAANYVQVPHEGGLGVQQPLPSDYFARARLAPGE